MASQDKPDNHIHGTMDIKEQTRTFAAFIRMSIWVIAISLGILVFLALVNS